MPYHTVTKASCTITNVVIPCYNSADTATFAVQSVIDGGVPQHDIIIVDDGSCDDTYAVIRSNFPNAKILRTVNSGVSAARNKGLELCDKELVVFLDSDDYIDKTFLVLGERNYERRRYDILFGNFKIDTEHQLYNYAPPRQPNKENIVSFLHKEYFVGSQCIIWRREFILGIGSWDQRILRQEDHELILRAISHDPRIASLTEHGGVWQRDIKEGTLSSRTTENVVASEILALKLSETHLEKTGFPRSYTKSFVDNMSHSLVRRVARDGNIGAYKIARAYWQERGEPMGYSSAMHRIGTKFVGLRNKEKISSLLKQYRRLVYRASR